MSETAVNRLIDYWDAFATSFDGLSKPPYIHQNDDNSMLVSVNRRCSSSASAARVEDHFDHMAEDVGTAFHLSLLPVPYLGDLASRTTDVFLLLLNPSAGYADYGTDACPAFREALIRNLKKDKNPEGDSRCLALNPQFWWSSWFTWYERLLNKTVRDYAARKGMSYRWALEGIARRSAIIELVPYYSVNAGAINRTFIRGLESARVAQAAAQELVRREDVLVVVVWGADRFGFERVERENVIWKAEKGLRGNNAEAVRMRRVIVDWLCTRPLPDPVVLPSSECASTPPLSPKG